MKNYKFFILIFLLIFISQNSFAQDIDELIEQGDQYYKKWENEKALDVFLKAYQIDEDNYEVVWRLSRAYSDLGEKMEDDKDKKKEYYRRAVKFGRRAVELNPDHYEGHLRLAIAVGRLALFEGGKKKIEMSKEVKAQIDTVKQLNPDNFLAYYIIGRWHREISNLNFILKAFAKIIYGGVPKASKEEALWNFEKAAELNPQFIEGNLALAEMYIKHKMYEDAKKHLKRCIDSPKTFMNDDKYKQKALKLYKKIVNK